MAGDEAVELNPQFQVGLDVAGRRCVVIGGGAEATDKTRRLLDARAAVEVVAPAVSPELRGWAAAGRIRHHRRRYRQGDLDGAVLVLNTVRTDLALCRQVFAAARRRRLPINTFDLPRYSTIAMGALVSCGPLRISISTSNASPTLARRLREDLEAILARAAGASAARDPAGGHAAAGHSAGGAGAGAVAADGADAAASRATASGAGDGAADAVPTDGTDAAALRATASGAGDGAAELEEYLAALGEVRLLAKRTLADPAARRARLHELVAGFRLTGAVQLPADWRQRLGAARAALEREADDRG